MPKIFLSHALGAARLPFAAAPPPPGGRWEELADAFRDGLLACGEQVVPVLRPEIYQTEVARRARGVAPGDWHLAVKPMEQLRPFHSLPNVFVSDWPFPTLSRATGGISPFFHQVRLLQRADAVACCTAATADTLRAAGIARAVHAPPFRPARSGNDGPASGSAETCTILAAAEAGLLLRHHLPLAQGFAAAWTRDRSLRLVLAVSGTAPHAAASVRDEFLAAAGAAEAAAAIDVLPAPLAKVLPDWQGRADFFLWDGMPLGLPLPLIDAALSGLPPIATGVAAAALGLPPGGCVPLAARPVPVDPLDEPVAQVMPLERQAPAPDDVRDAILAAAALDGEARAAVARIARREAERGFGLEAFRTGLRRLDDLLRSDAHAGR